MLRTLLAGALLLPPGAASPTVALPAVPAAAGAAVPVVAVAAVPVVAVAAAPAVAGRAPVVAAAATTATVRTGGGVLNARSGPSTADSVVRPLPDGVRLSVRCQVFGQHVRGTVRSGTLWNRLGNGSFVADGFVRWSPRRPAVPWCAGSAPTLAGVSTTGGRLVVRAGPRTAARPAGSLPNGFRVPVVCQAWGTRVVGTVRTTTLWYGIGGNRYLTAAYVRWSPAVPLLPYCGQAGATVPAGSPSAFIGRVARAARITDRRYGVPASVTIAQAILESGWGRSMLTRRDHNYFGIKCFGGPGPLAVGCRRYATSECDANGCFRTSAAFRVYRAPSGSLADHAYFLRSRPRYRLAFRYPDNPDRFVREIHRAGYATSPTYSVNLIGIMRKYGLYRYDG